MFGSSSKEDDGFLPSPFLMQIAEIEENHPRYYIKMFVKLILNYTNYNKQLLNLLKEEDPKLDVEEISKAGEMMLYGRAYQYLTKLDMEDKYHKEVLLTESNKDWGDALHKCLKFYEGEEEYEKCVILKQYLDFSSFSS